MAIATPPGRGGLGVVRLSGPSSHAIAMCLVDAGRPLQPRHATSCRVVGLDTSITTYFPGPHSYTGDDVVEISTHGSPVVLAAIVRMAMERGARLARPGEFTFRAFIHGKLDLIQAEAVADLIEAVTPLQARAAFDQLEGTLTSEIRRLEASLFDVVARVEASLDFPDEGYHFIATDELRTALMSLQVEVARLAGTAARGRLIREGATVVICGRPNSGKSSIFNNLIGTSRAIVDAVPGTTRDMVTERVELGGFCVTLVDTAGFRVPADGVEEQGIALARGALTVATVAMVVVDGSSPLEEDDLATLAGTTGLSRVVVVNKSDLPAAWAHLPGTESPVLRVSARTGDGIERLRLAVTDLLSSEGTGRDTVMVSNARQAALLDETARSLAQASAACLAGETEECVLQDLARARELLEEVTGRRTSEDVLRYIFDRFCIGK